jgi:hypothetical protein
MGLDVGMGDLVPGKWDFSEIGVQPLWDFFWDEGVLKEEVRTSFSVFRSSLDFGNFIFVFIYFKNFYLSI